MDAIGRLASGPFDVGPMRADLRRWADEIEPAIDRDPDLEVEPWRAQVERMSDDLLMLSRVLESWRDGTPAEPFALSGDEIDDFEGATDLETVLGTAVASNPASTIAVGIERANPIRGAQDLGVQFGYRDEGDRPYSQWALAQLGFGAAQELSSTSSVGLWLVADTPRTVRVELFSPVSERVGGGFGWDVDVGPFSARHILPVAEARVPTWHTGPTADRAEVLRAVTGIRFFAFPRGHRPDGLLGPEGDDGTYHVDDLELLASP